MAAVLACGDDAVLSHVSAAALWALLPQPRPTGSDTRPPPVQVTVPGRAGRRHRQGIRIHHAINLTPRDITRRNNIPVTSPSRTLIDLRRTLPQPQFARALRQAEFLGLPIHAPLDPDGTRSELEAKFLGLCRRHRLPLPEVNQRVGPYVVDFLWREQRLVVELDGYAGHAGRIAFEADRARDVELKLLGLAVVRFTWRQLTGDAARVAGTIRALLRGGSADSALRAA
jgi:very-short-patch-repair endonuclease